MRASVVAAIQQIARTARAESLGQNATQRVSEALANAFASSSAVSRSNDPRPKPAGGNVIPVKTLAGPVVSVSDLEAPAARDGFMLDYSDAGGFHLPQMFLIRLSATAV